MVDFDLILCHTTTPMFLIRLLRRSQKSILSYRNSGLGDNLLAAANAWDYAKVTGRSLVICWSRSRYLRDGGVNAFFQFFELPAEIQGVPVEVESKIDRVSSWIISYWHFLVPYPDLVCIAERRLRRSGALKHVIPGYVPIDGPRGFAADRRHEREQKIVYGGIEKPQRLMIATGCYCPQEKLRPFFDALKLTPDLAQQVEAFSRVHFGDKLIIGMHVRHYDASLPRGNHSRYWTNPEEGLAHCLDKIHQAIRRAGTAEHVVFLSTDSRLVQEFVKAHLDHVVTFDKQFGTDQSKELLQELPVETASQSLIEMFLLARSHILVRYPPESWFSHYASLYAQEILT